MDSENDTTNVDNDTHPIPDDHITQSIEGHSISKDERNLAMFTHLAAFGVLIIPLTNIIIPLIIWQMKKETMPFTADQAKESLNFQICMSVLILISAVLCIILIGIPFLIVFMLANIILTIIAAIAANDGVTYRYPFIIRLIK